ncbi:hypothetical protein D3C86_1596670 [compost metagenome]
MLITQTGGPVAIGDYKKQATLAPGRYMTVFAGGGLQLAFQQVLQAIDALRLVEQRFQGLRFAH